MYTFMHLNNMQTQIRYPAPLASCSVTLSRARYSGMRQYNPKSCLPFSH
jgi:hypothetical protein